MYPDWQMDRTDGYATGPGVLNINDGPHYPKDDHFYKKVAKGTKNNLRITRIVEQKDKVFVIGVNCRVDPIPLQTAMINFPLALADYVLNTEEGQTFAENPSFLWTKIQDVTKIHKKQMNTRTEFPDSLAKEYTNRPAEEEGTNVYEFTSRRKRKQKKEDEDGTDKTTQEELKCRKTAR